MFTVILSNLIKDIRRKSTKIFSSVQQTQELKMCPTHQSPSGIFSICGLKQYVWYPRSHPSHSNNLSSFSPDWQNWQFCNEGLSRRFFIGFLLSSTPGFFLDVGVVVVFGVFCLPLVFVLLLLPLTSLGWLLSPGLGVVPPFVRTLAFFDFAFLLSFAADFATKTG